MTPHHIAIYHGKEVIIDYVDPKREFRVAAMRIQDNLEPCEEGFVVTPKGQRYLITWGRKLAKLVK